MQQLTLYMPAVMPCKLEAKIYKLNAGARLQIDQGFDQEYRWYALHRSYTEKSSDWRSIWEDPLGIFAALL